MQSLRTNPRFRLLVTTAILAGLCYVLSLVLVPSGSLQLVRLSQAYGYLSIIYVLAALLITPVTKLWPTVPRKDAILFLRRAIGVSAAFFALLHSLLSLYAELDGIQGLAFLNGSYLFSIILGFSALVILLVLASISTDAAIRRLSFPRWKLIQRLVYIAGAFALIHALMIGSHYVRLTSTAGWITIIAVGSLLILEALRIDKARPRLQHLGIGPTVLSVTALIGLLVGALAWSDRAPISTNVHGSHAVSSTSTETEGSASRYSVSIDGISGLRPGVPSRLNLTVSDNASGKVVPAIGSTMFEVPRMAIIDSSLDRLSLLPLSSDEQGLFVTATFPVAGEYRLYFPYQPQDGAAQQAAFTVQVGESESPAPVAFKPDVELTKTSEGVTASLSINGSSPNPALTYRFSGTFRPESDVTVVLINQRTRQFAIATGKIVKGAVTLTPTGILEELAAGTYRAFVQAESTVGTTVTIAQTVGL